MLEENITNCLNTQGVEFTICHVCSHARVWVNEVVDNAITKSSEAMGILPIAPVSPVRIPRFLRATKNEIKSLRVADEGIFLERYRPFP